MKTKIYIFILIIFLLSSCSFFDDKNVEVINDTEKLKLEETNNTWDLIEEKILEDEYETIEEYTEDFDKSIDIDKMLEEAWIEEIFNIHYEDE